MDAIRYDAETTRALRLFVVLSRCFDSVAEQTRLDIRRHGMSVSEFGILELLYHKGPQPLGEVAERILLTTGSITYVMDQLEEKGLVKRVPCPKDRRRLYAELTDLGRERIGAVFPAHAEVVRNVVSSLDGKEQEEAIRLLKKLGLAAKDGQPATQEGGRAGSKKGSHL